MTNPSFDPENIPVSLTIVNSLGTPLTLHLQNHAQAISAQRYYGARGYTFGTLPNAGANLPLVMFLVFDFRLIGVNEMYVYGDGEDRKLHIKIHEEPYKHRLQLPDRKNKLPMKVNFSRGGKSTDDEERKTGDRKGGGFTYVQSVNFVGNSFIPRSKVWMCIPGSVDEKGNILTIYNQLPDPDNAELMRYLKETHFRNRELPPFAERLNTPIITAAERRAQQQRTSSGATLH